MKNEKLVALLQKNRLFDDEDFIELNIHQIIEFQSQIVNGNDPQELVYLMYGLDDDTMRFDITQILYEGITGFYFKNPNEFFYYFLKNIDILYPHAIEISKYILKPIFNLENTKSIICNQIDTLSENSKLHFKIIYEQMVNENHIYFDECISEKL